MALLAAVAGCAGSTSPREDGAGIGYDAALDATAFDQQLVDSGEELAASDRALNVAGDGSLPAIDVSDCGDQYLRFRYRLDNSADEIVTSCLNANTHRGDDGMPVMLDVRYLVMAGIGTRCWMPYSLEIGANMGVVQSEPAAYFGFDPSALSGHYRPFSGPGYFPFDGPRDMVFTGFSSIGIPYVPGFPTMMPAPMAIGFGDDPRFPACRFRVTQGARRFGDLVAASLETPCDLAQKLFDTHGFPIPTPHVMHLLALTFRGAIGTVVSPPVCADPF